MNPMLSQIYDLAPEKSSLFFTIAGVTFIITTPVAFQLRSRNIARRRTIIYVALAVMAFANLIRTGDYRGEAKIAWVYVSQIVNGIALALLTTTTFPEVVESVEKT